MLGQVDTPIRASGVSVLQDPLLKAAMFCDHYALMKHPHREGAA